MRKCLFCEDKIPDTAYACDRCAREQAEKEMARPRAAPVAPPPNAVAEVRVAYPTHVRIIDVDMPFWSMTLFMVKWAIASIPAALILVGVGFFVFVILTMAAALFQ